MKSFRDLSISRKLTLSFLSASILPLLLGVVLLLGYELASQRSRIVEQMIAQADMIAVSTRATLEFEDSKRAQETLATLRAHPEIIAASLYTAEGEVFAHYIRRGESSFKFPSLSESGHRILGDHLDLFHPIVAEPDAVGHVFLRVDMRILSARFPQYVGIVGIVLIGLVGVGFWISRAFDRTISRPILALARTAQAVQDSKDYSVRAQKQGEDEIGCLTDAFNQMVGDIEEQTHHLRFANESLQAEVLERRRVEDEIKLRSQELEAANKELEAFSYSVSHDLRAPLRAIDGFSKFLITGHASELSAEGRDSLEVIRSSTQQMGQLIDDLLDFSRLNRQALRKEAVPTDELVRHCLQLLQPETEGRRVEWTIGELPACEGDAGLLKLVWTNLLSNALKYTRKRDPARIEIGAMTSDAGRVTSDGEAASPPVTDHAPLVTHHAPLVYFVRDNGVGFNMKYADKLFGVFQRLHRAEDYEGTGVGLATVQRIIHRHGGRVWAEAELNKGATFFFSIEPAKRT